MDRGPGDPRNVLLELERAGWNGRYLTETDRTRGVGADSDYDLLIGVVKRQVQRQHKGKQRDRERAPLHGLAAVRKQRQQQRSGERHKDDEGQDGVVDIHRVLMSAPTASGQKSSRRGRQRRQSPAIPRRSENCPTYA